VRDLVLTGRCILGTGVPIDVDEDDPTGWRRTVEEACDGAAWSVLDIVDDEVLPEVRRRQG
jgi:hypothetical protein